MKTILQRTLLTLGALWLVCPGLLLADSGSESRPRIGLVLSGGGARGAAHVGVLQVLEELNVPVDFVIGTSMGSIVGGFYASGYSGTELEKILTDVDWNGLLSDRPPRRALPFRRKEDDLAFQFRGALKFDGSKVRIPAGAIEGRHILVFFRSLTLPVATIEDFDHLPLPFRAVATDIKTGGRVVLDSGDLALAMRASMSVPGIFAPIEHGEHLLVDGGISDNLPIDVARGLEPDVLIAVDVGDTMRDLDKESSVLAVFNQMLTALISRESQREAATLGPRDVLIVPDLEGIGSGDFAKVSEGIEAGRNAAIAAGDKLRSYSVSEEEYAAYRRGVGGVSEKPPMVDEIRVETENSIDPSVIRERLSIQEGEPLDMEALAADLDRLAGLDFLENVDFGIEPGDGDAIALRIEAERKQWGRNFIRLHLELFDDLNGDTGFGLGLRFTATQLNRLGMEARIDAVFGNNQLFGGELYQPLPLGFFVAPRVAYRAEDLPVFSGGVEIVQYRREGWLAGFDLGLELGHWGELRGGYDLWRVDAVRQAGGAGPPSLEFEERRARLLFRVDTLDHPNFASRGVLLEAQAARLFEGLADDRKADLAEIRFTQALSLGRFRFALLLEGGTLFDEDKNYYPFELGGFLRLSSLHHLELIGKYKALFSARALREIGGASFNMPSYVGLSLEAGNVWLEKDAVELGDLLWNGSLFLAVDSYLGPAFLGVGYGEGQRRNFYFALGRRF